MRVGFDEIVQEALYESYLRRMNAQAVLDFYGATNCSEQRNQKGEIEIVHSCLLDRVTPHHSHGDQNPSAACNIDRKKYVCYSLGWGGDLLHFIMRMEGKEEISGALLRAGEFLEGAVEDGAKLAADLALSFVERGGYTINPPSYDDSIIAPWINTLHPYWASRGISRATQYDLNLGYDKIAKRIVFPHYVKGALVGWQKRLIPGETITDLYAKYKNSPGFPKSETLYNLDEARHHSWCVVVESPMSVARAKSLGMPNVVATFGAKVSRAQVQQLADSSFIKVWVWFDRDGAGLSGEIKVVQGLYRHADVRVVSPDSGRDLGDVESLEEVMIKLFDAEPASLRMGIYDNWFERDRLTRRRR